MEEAFLCRFLVVTSGGGLFRAVSGEDLVLQVAPIELFQTLPHDQLHAGRIALLGEVVGLLELVLVTAVVLHPGPVGRTRESVDPIVLALFGEFGDDLLHFGRDLDRLLDGLVRQHEAAGDHLGSQVELLGGVLDLLGAGLDGGLECESHGIPFLRGGGGKDWRVLNQFQSTFD